MIFGADLARNPPRTRLGREEPAWDSGPVSLIRRDVSDLPRLCDTGRRDHARTRPRPAVRRRHCRRSQL
ncbi:hypothetical protein FRACA_2110007 [Frankia canadensis]|uniref:Uncharacterized protein n=1 Tax=Frankia canadensis TaxID=1836972 RepID=A0A2I2KQN4_9ACTN|nr:hypothetical protein FRACA_2110007 [Frankia canadensis]SOU55264.1 hypothetical protein FRACA_2110007 [Frankia canadensis]